MLLVQLQGQCAALLEQVLSYEASGDSVWDARSQDRVTLGPGCTIMRDTIARCLKPHMTVDSAHARTAAVLSECSAADTLTGIVRCMQGGNHFTNPTPTPRPVMLAAHGAGRWAGCAHAWQTHDAKLHKACTLKSVSADMVTTCQHRVRPPIACACTSASTCLAAMRAASYVQLRAHMSAQALPSPPGKDLQSCMSGKVLLPGPLLPVEHECSTSSHSASCSPKPHTVARNPRKALGTRPTPRFRFMSQCSAKHEQVVPLSPRRMRAGAHSARLAGNWLLCVCSRRCEAL